MENKNLQLKSYLNHHAKTGCDELARDAKRLGLNRTISYWGLYESNVYPLSYGIAYVVNDEIKHGLEFHLYDVMGKDSRDLENFFYRIISEVI